MKNHIAVLVGFVCMFHLAAYAQTPKLEEIKWQLGPSIGDLSGIADIRIPGGYTFAGAVDTRVILEASQNTASGNEVGLVAPTDLDWFVLFEFDNVGFVRDDEKNSLDAQAMLESIKEATEADNKERKRRGWPSMTVLGWEQKPHYDESTHNLEWAIRAESEGETTINYNTRLLGRRGVMRVTLVTDVENFPQTLSKFKNVLAGFEYKQGQKYAEFREGDKLAGYGLTALVVGGGSAVAVKTGLFKWVWKGLVIGFFALLAFLKNLFSRKKSQQNSV